MLANGNGAAHVCAVNLLRTIRGEVPFERTKGIDRELFDTPSSLSGEVATDIEWVLETFEPRIGEDEAETIADAVIEGDFNLYAEMEVEYGE